MIVATVAALEGKIIWPYLVWGLPVALGLATVWTQFILSTTVAEVHLRSGQCALRSVHDVLFDRSLEWHPLYHVRAAPGEVELSFGWTATVCRRSHWPEFARLREAAQHAHKEHSGHAGSPSVHA
jgi:hypothetical protein